MKARLCKKAVMAMAALALCGAAAAGCGSNDSSPTPDYSTDGLDWVGDSDAPVDIQEFMLVPGGFASFREAFTAGVEVYHALKKVLAGRGLATNVGDEGGFAPNLPTNRAALELLFEAIETAGYKPGEEVALALDVAASEIYREGSYQLEGRELSSEEMVAYLAELIDEFPLVSVEDGMDEGDWPGWARLTEEVGSRTQLVGDDLLVLGHDDGHLVTLPKADVATDHVTADTN